MGIIGKLECEVDIKSCANLFHEIFGENSHHVSNITQQELACELHEGDLGKPDSVVSWYYTIDGKKCVVKEILEVNDKEKKLVKYKVIGGDFLEVFKTMSISVQVLPKGDVSGVKYTFEFEKIEDDEPYPTKELDFLINRTREIEAHHLKP